MDPVAADSMDRISQLPDLLLHHILSFLYDPQVLETRTLSKTWLRAWNTFPILKFHEAGILSGRREEEEAEKKRKQLIHFMEQTLLSRQRNKLSVQEFTLAITAPDPELTPVIEQCVRYAIESNVERLSLSFKTVYEKYIVPELVLGATCLAVLELGGCTLKIPHDRKVKLPFLKKLWLLDIDADDESIPNLVAACPLLEHMDLSFCRGFETLSVLNVVKLMVLEVMSLHNLERIELGSSNLLHTLSLTRICVPDQDFNLATCCKNLRTLILYSICNLTDEWLLTQIPQLCFLEKLSLSGCDMLKNWASCCKNLRILILDNICNLTDEWLLTQIPQICFLEELSLSGCDMLKNAQIVSDSLATLCIESSRTLTRVEISTPNLHTLSYSGRLISFSSNSLVLSEVTMSLHSVKANARWVRELIGLLVTFNNSSTVFNLKLAIAKDRVVPKRVKEALSPGSYNFKEFNVEFPLSV